MGNSHQFHPYATPFDRHPKADLVARQRAQIVRLLPPRL
jgi:hypothetical protein